MENVVDRQTAEAEFNRFTDLMALDFNVEKMDIEDRSSFEKLYERLIKAIMNGSLCIDDEGQMVYTPQRTEGFTSPITFHEPTGADIAQMDKKKSSQGVGMMFAMAGSITRQSPSVFAKLKGLDYKICLGITTLFLD